MVRLMSFLCQQLPFNNLVLFYGFRHYSNDISMVIDCKQYFYRTFSGHFMIVFTGKILH